MGKADTTLGGDERRFPATSLGFAAELERDADRSLDTLARRYWKAVYSYLRIAWGRSNDDAKDLAQEFFAWLAEDGALAAYDRSKGGFRPFLKTLLRRFVSHDARDRARLKRGGGLAPLPLEGSLPDPSGESDPERAFDRAWLAERVEEAVQRARLAHPDRFRVYEAYALPAETPSYADVASRLGLSVGEVEKALHLVREEIRAGLREALAQSAGGDRELEDEWTRLLGG
jgi:RNA polymerase sigma-70 factor (ECF subfamily)